MTESTARATLFELQSSIGPSYNWLVPQKPVSVHIPFAVIDRLEHESVESFRSLSSRGSEIGGLLFGSVTPGEIAQVSIEDFELIPCDYSRGPLYRLADADMSRFDKVILQHGSAGSLAAIGMFRSHTRKGLSLDAEDLAFFDSRFREAHNIALLIRPFATKASSAGIFIRENGVVHGEASPLEFPFRSSLLTAGKPAGEAPAASSAPAATPASAAPKAPARAQIVPIASRRENTVATPAENTPVAKTVEAPPAEKAPLSSAPAPAAPPAEEKATKPAVEVKETKPAVDQKVEKPQAPAESKSAAPKVEAKTAQPAEAKPAKPAENKAVPPKVEEKGAKPAVEEKSVPAKKADEKAAKPVVEEKTPAGKTAVPSFGSGTSTSTPVEEEPAKKSNKMIWIGVGAAVPLLLLIAFLVYPPLLHRGRPSGTPGQDSSALTLRVERTAGEILLTWNRDADAIRSATHAVLNIADGTQHDNVEMDLTQLRTGSISYAPATGDVVFKMEVTGSNGEKTASESVRALSTRPNPLAGPEGAPAPQQAVQQQPAAAKPGTPVTTPPAGAPNTPAQTAQQPNTPGQPPTPQTETPTKTPLKPFQAPSLSARLHPANPADLPDAPTMGRVETASSSSVAGLNMNTVSAPVAPAKPAAATPAPPPAADKKGAAANSGGQIQQAVLITRKDPEYPKLARETGAKGVVELVATIGTDGRVKSVKVVHGPPMLQKAASDAVLQWRYKPTMLNGVPVEAQTQVLVNFMGGDR